ncbi:MAG: VWA domain-containing protein, partial [Planctomycetales bacterium]
AIKIKEDPKWDVTVQWSEKNYLPKHPFVLYYQLASEPVGAAVLAHAESVEGGHFMMMLSPTIGGGTNAVTAKDVLPKDVVFCVDCSGSMLQGGKMEQARGALRHCLESLRPQDRFNIVDFGTGVRKFSDAGLTVADENNVQRALRYVAKLAPRGGTAMDEALGESLDMLSDQSRLKMILFATDGLPTIGERSPDAILKNMNRRNKQDARLFVFGEGYDVNVKLLDLLALEHRGESEYILPEEKVDEKIAAFFDRVGSPIMTDLKLAFDGLETKDVFPRKIPDVYKGEQVILYGRYQGGGTKTVRLTGNVGGETRTMEYQVQFPELSADDRNAFVPRLWAGEMVDFLLNEIRKSGKEDAELVREVTYLAKRYGIVTPYTSFLMVQDSCNHPLAKQVEGFQKRLRGKGGLLGPTYGYEAVINAKQQARNRMNLKGQGAAAGYYQQAADALKQEGRQGSAMAAVRYVGNRTFYNSRNVWYDSRFDVGKANRLQQVRIGSSHYLRLLRDHPTLSKYMAQGNVVVELKGQWYQFEDRPSSG